MNKFGYYRQQGYPEQNKTKVTIARNKTKSVTTARDKTKSGYHSKEHEQIR